MNDFKRCNIVTGVHWLKTPIQDLVIKIQLKHQEGTVNLPQYEEFTQDSFNIDNIESNKTEDYTFRWQEKVFSPWELSRYSNAHNCVTDTEILYHELIKKHNFNPQNVFTYTHDDIYTDSRNDNNVSSVAENLEQCFKKLNLGGKIGKMVDDSVSMGHLFRSEESLTEKGEWLSMHIVLDQSDYNDDTLLLKRDTHLVTLSYSPSRRCLLVSPDVNDLQWSPHSVDKCLYSVQLAFHEQGDSGDGEELAVLLAKLHKKWLSKNRRLLEFATPALGRRQTLVNLEIISAYAFDVDDLYIKYDVLIPSGVECSDPERGRTHTSRVLCAEDARRGEGRQWCFGHLAELCLLTDSDADPPPIKIILEVISSDWWGRQRTEGYSHYNLPLTPGAGSKKLTCLRPDEKDSLQADSRRFFVGGCHLIKDFDVLLVPQVQDQFRLTPSGEISIRWSVVSQCVVRGGAGGARGGAASTPLPAAGRAERGEGRASTSALLAGAQAALHHYSEARSRLIDATKDLQRGDLG